MDATLFVLIFSASIFLYLVFHKKKDLFKWNKPKIAFPLKYRTILNQYVAFYNSLSNDKKLQFENRVHEFLLKCSITGVETEVSDTEKVLIASSAVIPIFSFPTWQYNNIDEVLVYPSSFNEAYETEGENRNILGMVGSGVMERKMILSKQALLNGFANDSDKKNTAIHEFVHLIDKTDGAIDGIPALLLDQPYALPWVALIHKKIDSIYDGQSDINPYGATNKAEFFAVVSEYFFERPKLLKRKHPELYRNLERIFKQDLDKGFKKKSVKEINRNDPCPCGSGNKYKKCCEGKL